MIRSYLRQQHGDVSKVNSIVCRPVQSLRRFTQELLKQQDTRLHGDITSEQLLNTVVASYGKFSKHSRASLYSSCIRLLLIILLPPHLIRTFVCG